MKTSTYDENEWRLVPVVATHEMCGAPDSVWHPEAKIIWSQMLEAAPQPPTVEESLKVGEAVGYFIETSPGNWEQAAKLYAGQPGVVPLFAHHQRDAADAERKIRALRNRLISERTNYHQAALDHPFEYARALAEADINEFEQVLDKLMAAGRG